MDIKLLLFVQLASASLIYIFFIRKLRLPFMINATLLCAYITVPAYIAIKGIASAVYISDFIFPLLLGYYIINKNRIGLLLENIFFRLLLSILILLPIFNGSLLIILGKLTLDSKTFLETGIWLYRNVIYLLVFGVGITTNLDENKLIQFIKANIIFAAFLALLGLISYFGPFDMTVFEMISAEGDYNSYDSRIGSGFLGLFRASVGQWFASVAIMALGAFTVFKSGFKLVAFFIVYLAISVILLSYSRAGFLGVLIGGTLFLLCLAVTKRQPGYVIFFVVVPILFIASDENVRQRYFPLFLGGNTLYKEEATAIRTEAWDISKDYFYDHTDALLLGVGPANREEVSKITGAYGAHNEYIDVIYRMGVVGLFLELWLLYLMLKQFLMLSITPDYTQKMLAAFITSFIVANAFMGITQSNFLCDYATHTLGFYLYLLYGVFIGSGIGVKSQ